MNAAGHEKIKSDMNLLIKTLCSAVLVSSLAVSEGYWVFGLLIDRVLLGTCLESTTLLHSLFNFA